MMSKRGNGNKMLRTSCFVREWRGKKRWWLRILQRNRRILGQEDVDGQKVDKGLNECEEKGAEKRSNFRRD